VALTSTSIIKQKKKCLNRSVVPHTALEKNHHQENLGESGGESSSKTKENINVYPTI
jgi:hypothetical protein